MFSLRFYIWFILLFLLAASMLLITAVAAILWCNGIHLDGQDADIKTIITILTPVFYYIAFNAVIFSLAGTILLSRKIIRPVEKMIRQAEQFRGSAEKVFLQDDASGGMGRLPRAMNNMIRRLEHDHAALERTVAELKAANRELEETRNEMIQAEKLASIGRLTAGLAHEIGNPLGILSGYMTILEDPAIDQEERREIITRTKNELERIDTLVRRLLSFARPQSGKAKPCSLNEVISECVKDLEVQPLFRKIRITRKNSAENDMVLGDPLQLRQVILNCMVNSADAIKSSSCGENGMITVITKNIYDEAGRAAMVEISINDNGTGIEEGDVNSVFDPFFTSKEPGKGTGLGLSVCYMIIRGMKGDININGNNGQGATVTIRLPLYAKQHNGT